MSIIEFPGRGDPPEDRSDDEIHAEAFRDLEGHISDCVCMGQIAADLMANTKCKNSKLAFSVFHLTEMLLNLEKQYMGAWKGEGALAYRLIRHPAKSAEQVKEAVIDALSEHPAEDQP